MTSAVFREIVTSAALPASPISPLLSMCSQFPPQILTPFSLRINTPFTYGQPLSSTLFYVSAAGDDDNDSGSKSRKGSPTKRQARSTSRQPPPSSNAGRHF